MTGYTLHNGGIHSVTYIPHKLPMITEINLLKTFTKNFYTDYSWIMMSS